MCGFIFLFFSEEREEKKYKFLLSFTEKKNRRHEKGQSAAHKILINFHMKSLPIFATMLQTPTVYPFVNNRFLII